MTNPFEDDDALNQYCEEVVYSILQRPTKTSFGYRASCPVCHEGSSGNRKKRFQYYYDTHSAFCFNSGCPLSEKGMSGLQLTALLKGITQSMENVEYMKWYSTNISETLKKAEDFNIDSVNPDKHAILPNTHESRNETKHQNLFEDSWIDLPQSVRDYCDSRKMFSAPFAPDEWKLYFDMKTKRLVIPWMHDGDIVYYQKRSLMRGDDPKYLYPSNIGRPIFNIDKIDPDFPYIYVTEGAIDCCFLKNGIACGGLVPSNDQKEELNDLFPGFTIVILTDNQWVDRSARTALIGDRRSGNGGLIKNKMNEYKFFIWPKIDGCNYKDINECVCYDSKFHFFHDEKWLKDHTYDALQATFVLNC